LNEHSATTVETVAKDPRSWPGWKDFESVYLKAQGHTLVLQDRCWVLYSLVKMSLQLPGNVYEAGVYKGGTAIILRHVMSNAAAGQDSKVLRLFDTFAGMPETNAAYDFHQLGDFQDTDLETVKRVVGDDIDIAYHQGLIPESFSGLPEEQICFAHVDVDIYQSVLDACAFLYPRLSVGGFILFDDYGFPTCPGARKAVDEYFSDKQEEPRLLPTLQAVVNKIGD
jgi:O-methyltransferase